MSLAQAENAFGMLLPCRVAAKLEGGTRWLFLGTVYELLILSQGRAARPGIGLQIHRGGGKTVLYQVCAERPEILQCEHGLIRTLVTHQSIVRSMSSRMTQQAVLILPSGCTTWLTPAVSPR
jgi:hypothetical protein